MQVVHKPEIESWLNQIGQQLAKAPQANAYLYYFKVVNEPFINAFALPGGPMYVHTGLLQAADTEGEVVGVLARNVSRRVDARRGPNRQTADLGQLFGVAEAAVGVVVGGQCGLICELGEMGARPKLLTDEILAGVRTRCRPQRRPHAGVDRLQPHPTIQFFERQAKLGTAAEPKGLVL